MDNVFRLEEMPNDRMKTAQEAVRVAFKSLSLLADSLISEAEKQTKTREEYIAFMKGAAFLFYRVCQRDDMQHARKQGSLLTPEDAVKHCWALFPFMTEIEKEEHFRLVKWLNKLIEFEGRKPIPTPKEYLKDKDIKKSLESIIDSGY